MDFSIYTLEELDLLDIDIIKNLNFNDYNSYEYRNIELGRCYKVDGIQNDGERYYGFENKSLSKNDDGEWKIGVWMCGPVFKENPICVDEETFIKTMLDKWVKKQKIDEFIAYEVNWDDF